jgi:peptidoglycan/LPS O-acetylase OafA/YrhL
MASAILPPELAYSGALGASDVAKQGASGDLAGAAGRVASVDALRGLMALAVAVYHIGALTHAFAGGARRLVVVLGVYSVEGFFVISGFCFFHVYANTAFRWPELRRFHLRRFFRIAPLYYFAVLLGVVFALDQTVGPRVNLARVIQNLTLSFGLVHPNHAMVIGGWSIGIEYVFYLAFPLLLWLTKSRPLLYALAILLVAWALPYNFGIVQSAAEPRKFHAYVQVPNHAFLFLLGGIVVDLRARIGPRLPLLAVLAALGMIGLCAAQSQPDFLVHLDVMIGMARVKYIALCALTVLLVALAKPATGAPWRALGWLGDLSYSVYLMHPFAWLIVAHFLPPAFPALGQLALGLVATLALAALTRRVVEQPSYALGRKLAG